MPLYQVLILAIVQGLTEFLPVSSSAHLAIFPKLFGWKDPGLTFDVALHFGTLIATLIYFSKDLYQLVLAGLRIQTPTDPDLRAQPNLMWFIGLGTLPVVLAGLLLEDQVETTFRDPRLIAATLIGFGLLLGWADLRLRNRTGRAIADLSFQDVLLIGLAQSLAIIPGTSRSGVTLTAALALGISRYAGARFSFLLATPAIFGAALKAAYDMYKAGGVPADMQMPFLVGILVSGITGGLVIKWFLHFLKRFSMQGFVAYRVAFGILLVALAILNRW